MYFQEDFAMCQQRQEGHGVLIFAVPSSIVKQKIQFFWQGTDTEGLLVAASEDARHLQYKPTDMKKKVEHREASQWTNMTRKWMKKDIEHQAAT